MNKLLFIALLTVFFLSACTSTQSLTNCPKFNSSKKSNSIAKVFNKNKKKDKQKNRAQIKTRSITPTASITKAEQKQAKKIDRLINKMHSKLASKKVSAKINRLPKKHKENLYSTLSKLDLNKSIEEVSAMPSPINQKITASKLMSLLEKPVVNIHKENIDLSPSQQIALQNTVSRKNYTSQEKIYAKRTQGFAIAALVCGIASFFLTPIPLGILAIVFGRVAQRKIIEEPSLWDGEGMAKAGIVLGIVALALFVLIFGVAILAAL